jgi:hypothetical protein
MSAAPPFDWRSISSRVLFAMLLVFAVYNPSGRFSYWHWLISGEGLTFPPALDPPGMGELACLEGGRDAEEAPHGGADHWPAAAG